MLRITIPTDSKRSGCPKFTIFTESNDWWNLYDHLLKTYDPRRFWKSQSIPYTVYDHDNSWTSLCDHILWLKWSYSSKWQDRVFKQIVYFQSNDLVLSTKWSYTLSYRTQNVTQLTWYWSSAFNAFPARDCALVLSSIIPPPFPGTSWFGVRWRPLSRRILIDEWLHFKKIKF